MRALLLVLVVLLVGCDTSMRTSTSALESIAARLSYIKDKHGMCYAVISSLSYGTYAVVSITDVPCEKVGL